MDNETTTHNDNIYPAGMIIAAKVNPALKLVIKKYCYRIYYCEVINDPNHKLVPYFERELIPPVTGD